MTGTTRQIAVVLAALFNVGMNGLAGAGVLFDTQTGAVSDSIRTGITPAGWAFSIWGVIFLGVLVFAAYQARPATRGPRYDAIALPFIAANLLNGLWQLPWLSRLFGVAAIVICGILASLVWLYIRLDWMGMSKSERLALGVPTSLFFAWLCVATPLNITVSLVAIGWTGAAFWPALLVLIVSGIGAVILWRTGDVAFAAVLVWAFAAILAKNALPLGTAPLLTGALALGAVLFLGATARGLQRGGTLLPASP